MTPYEKAIELLARRPHSRAELAQKLLHPRYAFVPQECDEALEKLIERGYLDDTLFAESFFRMQNARGKSVRHIHMLLMRKWVDPAIIHNESQQYINTSDALQKAIKKKQNAFTRAQQKYPKDWKQRCARQLIQQGFAPSAVFSSLDDWAKTPDK